MPAINLLPQELKPKAYILKLSKTFKKIALIGFLIFSFSGIIVIGSLLIVSDKLKSSLSRQENLKLQIKALQDTEQRLFLVKDKLVKVGKIYQYENVTQEVDAFDEILKGRFEGIDIKEAKLSASSLKITVLAGQSSDLSSFLTFLVDSENSKRIEMESFTYKPNEGYEAKIISY